MENIIKQTAIAGTEKITVSYNSNWDCEGHHTTQNIKLPKKIFNIFNDYLSAYRKTIQNNHIISSAEADILMYGKAVINLNRCLTLTQLRLLYQFLSENKIDCSRLKTNRNTMINVY